MSDKDKAGLSAEYSCIYGIAKPVKGLIPGDSHRAYSRYSSNLVIIGKDSRVFFFHFTKLERRMFGSEIPRYTKADEEPHIKPYLKTHVTDKILWEDVWKQRIFTVLSPLEESVNEHWQWGRFVCLGDSIHKVTLLLSS